MKFLNSNQSFSWNIFLIALWLKFETSAHSQIAITRSSTLFTNFLTCHELETLYWDTSRKTKLVNYFINLLDTFFKNLFCSVNWTVLLPNLLRPNFTFIVCVKMTEFQVRSYTPEWISMKSHETPLMALSIDPIPNHFEDIINKLTEFKRRGKLPHTSPFFCVLFPCLIL